MALSIRVAGAGGMFLSQVMLARSLGVAGFGEYSLVITWLQVFTVLAKLGMDNTSLRYVSEYVTKSEFANLQGFIRTSRRATLVASTAVMVTVTVAVLVFWQTIGAGMASCLLIAAMMIPLVSLRQIQEASLRGVGQLFESQIGTVVWPWTLCMLAAIAWQTSTSHVSSITAMSLHMISICAVSILVFQFYRHSSLFEHTEAASESCRPQWTRTAMVFLLAEILIALKSRACVALAGILLDRESIGLYGAMEKFADVTVLASQSLGLVIAPQFASLYAAGRFSDMRSLMRQGQILGLVTTLPLALILACFGDAIFVVLGPEYRQGWGVLMALLCAACIASFAGPAAYVLQMSGRERTMLVITAASAATNILLSLLLMRTHGLMGLGIAQLATSFVWMVGVRWSLSRHPAWQQTSIDRSTPRPDVQSEVSP